MKPENVVFRFRNNGRPVVVAFERPTKSGQFTAVRLVVAGHVWNAAMKPGEYKPRITDCRRLFERYCRIHADRVQPAKGSKAAKGSKSLKIFKA